MTFAHVALLWSQLPVLQWADPTGLSSVWGKLGIAAVLVSVIVLAVRWLWENRNR